MWERFSYYGMRAFLILYMVAPVSGRRARASPTPTRRRSTAPTPAASWGAAILGGLVADRFLGQYRSVLVGGIIIALGHFTLAFKALPFFYAGPGADRRRHRAAQAERQHAGRLALRAGRRAPRRRLLDLLHGHQPRRASSGRSIAGYLAQRVDWHIGFACGRRRHGARRRAIRARARSTCSRRSTRLGSSRRPRRQRRGRERRRRRRGGFTAAEWKRIGAIVIFFLVAILFWGAYEQAGSTLNLFADRYTRLELFGFSFPSSWFQSVQPIFVILLAPVFAWLWMRLGPREPSVPAKFALGLLFMGLAFLVLVPAGAMAQSGAGVRVSPWWLIVVVRHLRARRAVPQPGRPERRHQAGAARASSA